MSHPSTQVVGPMKPSAIAWVGAASIAALAVPSAVAWAVDDRTLFGANVWDKPLRFHLALTIHLLTLWALLRLLPIARRATLLVRRAVWVGVVCLLIEALYITLQAARGRASHFNVQTPQESFLYFGVMGPAAVLIVVSSFFIGWQMWRHSSPSAPAGLRLGAALGLMLGSVATLLVASVLSAGAVSGLGHWVGGVRSDSAGLAVFGWSRTGGDLRVPHFFATHLMQALPVAGWVADRLSARHARGWVAAAALMGLSVVAGTFWQAVHGQPLFSL